MVGRVVYIELERVVKPWTVYLALHQRYDDPVGEFNWSIVMTLANGSSCVVFQASNLRLSRLLEGDWRIEENIPGQWDAETSPSLLCMFEIKICMRADIMANQRDSISRAGLAIIGHRSVSSMRPGQSFNSKTFALDVLAASIERVSGTNSLILENRATAAALMCRQQALDVGALMRPGWFKIFRLETVHPVNYPW